MQGGSEGHDHDEPVEADEHDGREGPGQPGAARDQLLELRVRADPLVGLAAHRGFSIVAAKAPQAGGEANRAVEVPSSWSRRRLRREERQDDMRDSSLQQGDRFAAKKSRRRRWCGKILRREPLGDSGIGGQGARRGCRPAIPSPHGERLPASRPRDRRLEAGSGAIPGARRRRARRAGRRPGGAGLRRGPRHLGGRPAPGDALRGVAARLEGQGRDPMPGSGSTGSTARRSSRRRSPSAQPARWPRRRRCSTASATRPPPASRPATTTWRRSGSPTSPRRAGSPTSPPRRGSGHSATVVTVRHGRADWRDEARRGKLVAGLDPERMPDGESRLPLVPLGRVTAIAPASRRARSCSWPARSGRGARTASSTWASWWWTAWGERLVRHASRDLGRVVDERLERFVARYAKQESWLFQGFSFWGILSPPVP